ncbi:MAG TPA: peptidase E [Tepidisphaeraceae bacterium]|nr:peptidase E [Tepidisphaeraceae bacterium]
MSPHAPSRQIVAMGGGGFSLEPRNLRLDRYVLGLARSKRPRICFVPTASGDSRGYVQRFYAAMKKHDCRPSDLGLFRRNDHDPGAHLLAQDVIYVGGGNTANLLAVWRLHGVDRAMREAWRRGVVLCGVSAGMICWFESSLTDSFGPLRALNDGLGLLPGSACPHYDGESRRRPTFHRLIRAAALPPGVAADDGAAIHFVGRSVRTCVASRPRARGYLVRAQNGRIVEEALPTTFLD